MNEALNFAWRFFLVFLILDALANFDLATYLWQLGWEPYPGLGMIWQRWSYAELNAFHLV